MRISLWSYYLAGLTPEQMVETFAGHGWMFAELSSEHGHDLLSRGDAEQVGGKFKAFAEDRGFAFPQAHFDLSANICRPPGTVERQTMLDNMKRWADLFMALGVRAGVLHPGGEDPVNLDWSTEVLQALISHVADGPTVLCLENSWRHQETMQLVDNIDSPRLATCMDTGHLNLTGGNWRDYIHWAGDRLQALHIADNMGETDDHLLPGGRGTIDWTGFGDALRRVHYQGLFNFEVGGESSGEPLDARLEKLAFIRGIAESILADRG